MVPRRHALGERGAIPAEFVKCVSVPFHGVDELVEGDMLSPQVGRFLRACVQWRLSIVYAGAPGSGKTTLMSCCCSE
ncbi:MAG: CpaF/VirB11 family protein, partial [Acidimicrobiia bacterium]|nr:CpaF/VirB11 family protein [Acidimicrobiia bacterium]